VGFGLGPGLRSSASHSSSNEEEDAKRFASSLAARVSQGETGLFLKKVAMSFSSSSSKFSNREGCFVINLGLLEEKFGRE
jgi:hypothetical protein